MMFFMLPKPLPDTGTTFSWLIVGAFSAWGGIVRYLMDNRASGQKFSWHGVFSQILISGFTGFLAGIYGYEQGYSNSMTMVFSGLGGALGGRLLDFLWKRLSESLGKNHSRN